MTRITAQRSFEFPSSVLTTEQVNYCIGIINRYRRELPILRTTATKLKDKTRILEDEVEYWKKKYKEKEKEVEDLKKEIEKLNKTKNRYQIALFDHGNFTHPDQADKKSKGGQIGHVDTNRESHEDYSLWQRKRIFAKACGNCGKKLSRVTATRQKILLDIVIHPDVVKQTHS